MSFNSNSCVKRSFEPYSRIIIAIIFILLSSYLSAANAQSPASGHPPSVEGSGISTIQNGSLKIKGLEIRASLIEYDKKHSVVRVKKDFILFSEIGRITGNNLFLKLDTNSINAENITFFDVVSKLYIQAEKSYGTVNELELENATLTNCDPGEPGWQISLSYLKYYPNDIAYGNNLLFYLHDVPVFYTPFYLFSTVSERASGFYHPQLTYSYSDDPSAAYGLRFQTPYFINIRQDNDLTIVPDIIERRGIGAGLEYNYAFTKGMYGQLSYWGIDENKANRTLENNHLMSKDDDPTPYREKYNFFHNQILNSNQQVFFYKQKNGDNEINREYFESSVANDVEHRSTAGYIYSWEGGYFEIMGDEYASYVDQSIYEKRTNGDTTASRLPEININHSILNLPLQQFYLDFSDKFTQFGRNLGWKGQRNIFATNLNFRDKFDFLNMSAVLNYKSHNYGVQYAADSDSNNTESENETDRQFAYNFTNLIWETGFDLVRNDKDSATGETSRYVISPSIGIQYFEDVDQRDALSASPAQVETLSQTSTDYRDHNDMFDSDDISYGYFLTTAKLNFTGDLGHTKWGLNLESPQDMWRKDSEEETEEFYEGPVIEEVYRENPYGIQRLPLRSVFTLSPTPTVNFQNFSRYDDISNEVLENKAKVTFGRKNKFGVTAHYNKQSYKFLDGTLTSKADNVIFDSTMYLWSYWRLYVQTVWDLTREKNEDQLPTDITQISSKLDFLHSCYTFSVAFDQKITTSTVDGRNKEKYAKSVEFNFTLKDY